MAYKTGAMGNGRNFGLNGRGPGKGSADRTGNRKQFNKHLECVKMSGVPASQDATFRNRGAGRFIKKYS